MEQEITPDTKVKITLKDAVVIMLAISGYVLSTLTYFGVIPSNHVGAQVVACEACPNLVTRDKLMDTTSHLQLQINNLKENLNEFKAVQNEMKADVKETRNDIKVILQKVRND